MTSDHGHDAFLAEQAELVRLLAIAVGISQFRGAQEQFSRAGV